VSSRINLEKYLRNIELDNIFSKYYHGKQNWRAGSI
jgi:hypothetical protein